MFNIYVLYAFLYTLMTWGLTALGGAAVFVFKKINENIMSLMFGFGAGVMISASFFSLILPAVEQCENLGQIPWLIVSLGFLTGGALIFVIDILLPHLHIGASSPEGIKSNFTKKILLVLSITLHNIPEGLAIGVAFGAAGLGIGGSTMNDAIALAIGIGLQNFPEGMAVSMPLRSEGMSRRKSFFYGQASGMVEPISAVIGAVLVMLVRPILPFVLCLAAGAMIYVVAEELIPSANNKKMNKLGTIGVIIGFIVMMALDVGLG